MVLKVYEVLRCASSLWAFVEKYDIGPIGLAFEFYKRMVKIEEAEKFILDVLGKSVPAIKNGKNPSQLTENERNAYEATMNSDISVDIEPFDDSFTGSFKSVIDKEDWDNISVLMPDV